jgi:hypothetical protein
MEEAEKCERVSKETALVIGLQIERLSEALDAHDYEKLEAMSMRLQTTAQKYGIDSISETAQELFGVLKSDRNEDTIIQLANEILDLCRATQHSFLDVETVHGEMVDKAPKEQDNSRKCGSRLSQLTS